MSETLKPICIGCCMLKNRDSLYEKMLRCERDETIDILRLEVGSMVVQNCEKCDGLTPRQRFLNKIIAMPELQTAKPEKLAELYAIVQHEIEKCDKFMGDSE